MKKITIALISVIICCVLVSCGEKGTTDTSGGDIAGEDWRTTGIVSDYGSITRGGVKTDILICVHKKDAAFYYDSPSQTIRLRHTGARIFRISMMTGTAMSA